MIVTVDWKYENELFHCVDDDKFYCHILGRVVDLGWDYYTSTVDSWVSTLNKISCKIYKKMGKAPNEIKLNQHTFDLIQLESNYYYNNRKLNHYVITILENVKNNEIELFVNGKIEGKINVVN